MKDNFGPPAKRFLVCGGGGSRSILASSGALLAAHSMNISSWHSIGGVSGGSLPSVLLASGKSAPEITKIVMDVDFNSLLSPRSSLLKIWWAAFLKDCAWNRRSTDGALSSEKLGNYLDELVPFWPERFWTIAVAGEKQLLFTAGGVYSFETGKPPEIISPAPAPLGMALRATCAVPGLIDAIPLFGEKLLDGGLAEAGRCPITVAKEHLGAPHGSIVAIDVGEEKQSEAWFFSLLRKLVCGPCCEKAPDKPLDTEGVLLICPDASAVQTLEFKLSREQKWQVLMAGFLASVNSFASSGAVAPDLLARAKSISLSYDEILRSSANPGQLTGRVERLLSARGLYF